MSRAEFPPCWLFGLRWPNTRGYSLFDGANGGLQEGSCHRVLPRTSAACVLIPAVSHIHPLPLLETLQHYQVGLVQSPMGSLLLPPGSWYAHYFVCALQESLFPPVLWKSCNQIPLAFKSNSLGIPSPIAGPPDWDAWHRAQNLHSSRWASVV